MPDRNEPRAQEPTPIAPETTPGSSESILDLDKYQALYGRLFLAATSQDQAITKSLLDPKSQISQEQFDQATSETQNPEFNHVVGGLSMSERLNAWGGKNFNEAYRVWSGSLRSSMGLSKTQERKDVIRQFTGKDHTAVTDEDVQNLYDTYCRDGSNVDAFVKKALENSGSREEIKWLATKLFGKNSGNITARIFELQASFKNDRLKLNHTVFSDLNRLNNNLSDEEKTLLSQLSEHVEPKAIKAPVGADQSPRRDWRSLSLPPRGQKFVDNSGKVGEILSNPITTSRGVYIRVGFADGSSKEFTVDKIKDDIAMGHLKPVPQNPAPSLTQPPADTPSSPGQDDSPAPASPSTPEPTTPNVGPAQVSEPTTQPDQTPPTETSPPQEPTPQPAEEAPSAAPESAEPEITLEQLKEREKITHEELGKLWTGEKPNDPLTGKPLDLPDDKAKEYLEDLASKTRVSITGKESTIRTRKDDEEREQRKNGGQEPTT